MKTKFFLLLCLLTNSYTVMAAGECPDGYYFTGRMIQGQGMSYPECAPDIQQPQQQARPQAPRGHWETRWGAIAIDGVKGKAGGVINHKSEKAAKTAAMNECYSLGGGKGCKIHLVYYNQCATVAWGDDMYTSSGRGTLEQADRDTVQRCNKITTNCKVVYNACSKPAWISY